MKKIKRGLFQQICDIENIYEADKQARKGKCNWGIKKHDKHPDEDNLKLQKQLLEHSYQTSEYSTFKIYEPKERIIFRLPYYPDRIVHWSIMLILEQVWTKLFIGHTYSCIKGRGIHQVVRHLKRDLKNYPEETKYCLKMDVRKFYPSINHDILKEIVRKKIADKDLLQLLDEIIDSTDGVPIGNYLSQFLANLYLTYFDHWILEELKPHFNLQGVSLKYYRYADDIVILSNSKEALHTILILIKMYLRHMLKLELKPNYQVFPVESRGIDFVGYKFYHTHILLRKRIKTNLKRVINKFNRGKITINQLEARLTAYAGWLKYCNSKHLLQKIEDETLLHFSNWKGKQILIGQVFGPIHVYDIIQGLKYYKVCYTKDKKSRVFKSKNKKLLEALLNARALEEQFQRACDRLCKPR